MKNNLIFTVLLCFFVALAHAGKPGKLSQSVNDFYAAIDAGDNELVGNMLADDVKATLPFSPEAMDKATYQQLRSAMLAAFPKMQHKVLEVVEGKSSVAYKAIFAGSNTGPLRGNPPTGNWVEQPFLGYMKFDKNGKITELDIQFDVASFNAQLMKGKDPELAMEKTIRELFKLMDEGQTDKFPMYCAANFTISNPFLPEPSPVQAFQGIIQSQKTAFPDMEHEVVEMVFDGRNVVTKGIFKGTNTGSMMGNPPTGNRVELPFLVLDKFDGQGKFVSRDVQFDSKSLEAQLLKGFNPVEMSRMEVGKIFEALNKYDLNAAVAGYSPSAKFHGWGPQTLDLDGYKSNMNALIASFPDAVFTVDEIITEGDRIVVRHHLEGTHTGAPFMGTKASKKKVFVPATVLIWMQNGKPQEFWLNADFLGLMMQIGAVPTPKS